MNLSRTALFDLAVARGLRRTGRGNLALSLLAKAVAHEDGRLDVTISTDAPDRHGDIVEPAGAELEAFQRNPVVMWAHDYRNLPIGRAEHVRVEGNALRASVAWAPTDFAREVAELYRRGYLRGWSIGFRPLEWQERRDEKGALLGYRITRWELLEFSGVPVPANPEALTNALRDGLLTHRSLLKSLGLTRAPAGDAHALPSRAPTPGNPPEPLPEPANRAGEQAKGNSHERKGHLTSGLSPAAFEANAQEIAARLRGRLRRAVSDLVRDEWARRSGAVGRSTNGDY